MSRWQHGGAYVPRALIPGTPRSRLTVWPHRLKPSRFNCFSGLAPHRDFKCYTLNVFELGPGSQVSPGLPTIREQSAHRHQILSWLRQTFRAGFDPTKFEKTNLDFSCPPGASKTHADAAPMVSPELCSVSISYNLGHSPGPRQLRVPGLNRAPRNDRLVR